MLNVGKMQDNIVNVFGLDNQNTEYFFKNNYLINIIICKVN